MKLSMLFCTYILSFFYILFLIILYFSKVRLDNNENKIYRKLLITNFIGIVVQIIGDLAPFTYNETFIYIVAKFILVYFNVWVSLLFLYVLEISNLNNSKVNKIIAWILLLTSIVIFVLPFDVFIDKVKGVYYINGLGTNFVYVLSVIYVTLFLVIIFIKRKVVSQRKVFPIYMLTIFFSIGGIIQYFYPEITIIVPIESFVCLVMYFTIENPDVKMLAEVSEARDQADKANRAKSDFLSSMSHEIRTPLNAIVGLSEDIASYIDQVPPEVVEDTKDIQNASQTLLEIVGNILDISKIESNRMEIINVPYNPKEEIEGLCKVTATRIGDKPIDYTLTIADDVPYELIGDKGKVKEIVNNLFTNSIKYTEKGQINLTIKCVNDFDKMYSTLYITCQDTGRGIKADSISRLFEKFDRLDVERNTTAEGTGLGLAITKKMIEMMGGKINVSSQFGVGSIFMVALPQRINKIAKPEGEDELSDTARLANSNFDLGQRRILIVDDNNLNIKVATKALKDFNFDLDSCNSGQECLNKVASGEQYDLILMDIMMPGMSGETTLHNLQQTGTFTTPVIALTADAVAGAQEKYISAGFVDYIAKPFSRDQIKGKLEKIFINRDN